MLADFTITLHQAERPLAVQVKVYENVGALRGACTKYAKKTGMKKKADLEFSGTLGICHRFYSEDDPLCAIVRLAAPNLGSGIISHELVHAAVMMWEIHNKGEHIPLTDANDEWFAWVLGELVRQTVNKLYEKGIYSNLEEEP